MSIASQEGNNVYLAPDLRVVSSTASRISISCFSRRSRSAGQSRRAVAFGRGSLRASELHARIAHAAPMGAQYRRPSPILGPGGPKGQRPSQVPEAFASGASELHPILKQERRLNGLREVVVAGPTEFWEKHCRCGFGIWKCGSDVRIESARALGVNCCSRGTWLHRPTILKGRHMRPEFCTRMVHFGSFALRCLTRWSTCA